MQKTQWYYRGSLCSCNYHCSYCPFFKGKGSRREREQDRQGLERFTDRMCELLTGCSGGHGILFMPYGEALIHGYYWKQMARLSRLPAVEAVGAQTNLSFPVEASLEIYREAGGQMEKLRLLCSFHPQMADGKDFLEACQRLLSCQVSFSAGTVGLPEYISEIRYLRENLPPEVYLWINRKDGRAREYQECFTEIDPWYGLEFIHPKAVPEQCGRTYFIREEDQVTGCCLSRQRIGSIYEDGLRPLFSAKRLCDRSRCSCYQAYCHMLPEQLEGFGSFPAFRIPFIDKSMERTIQ